MDSQKPRYRADPNFGYEKSEHPGSVADSERALRSDRFRSPVYLLTSLVSWSGRDLQKKPHARQWSILY